MWTLSVAISLSLSTNFKSKYKCSAKQWSIEAWYIALHFSQWRRHVTDRRTARWSSSGIAPSHTHTHLTTVTRHAHAPWINTMCFQKILLALLMYFYFSWNSTLLFLQLNTLPSNNWFYVYTYLYLLLHLQYSTWVDQEVCGLIRFNYNTRID